MRHIIGIDLGGTNIVAGCVAEDGSAIHGVRSVPTRRGEGPDAVVDRIIATAQESLEAVAPEVSRTQAHREWGSGRRGRSTPTPASCC